MLHATLKNTVFQLCKQISPKVGCYDPKQDHMFSVVCGPQVRKATYAILNKINVSVKLINLAVNHSMMVNLIKTYVFVKIKDPLINIFGP